MRKLRSDAGKSRRSWIALIGVAALVLSACSPAESESTTTAAESSTTAGETSTTEGTGTTGAPLEPRDPVAMRFGAILPQTGALSSIIAALEEPLSMAAEEINAVEAGLVTVDFADDGTNNDIASTNIDQYLTGSHNAVLGPAASGVANFIWDKVNTAGMVMCSGTSTGAGFSSPTYNPNHVRTAPSDLIQAPLLAQVIVDDGQTNVAVVWRADDYGVGFGEQLASTITGAGGTVPLQEGYDPAATSFTDLAQAVVDSGAEALAMITFGEGAQLLLDLESAGFAGDVYVADGFVDTVKPANVGDRPEVLEGIRGTYPAVAPTSGEATFGERFAAFAPEGTPTVFSAHMYDCLVTLFLAAQVAQSADPTVYVNEIIGVTRDGEKCSLVADCLELVWAGADIDYDGASGVLDFSENGEPGIGIYNVFTFDAAGAPVNEPGEITGELP